MEKNEKSVFVSILNLVTVCPRCKLYMPLVLLPVFLLAH